VPDGVSFNTHPVPHTAEVGSVGKELGVVAMISRYEAAVVTALQVRLGVVTIPVAPLVGDCNVGFGNVTRVLKLRIAPRTVVAPLLATTR
jgi:hypothetical protein